MEDRKIENQISESEKWTKMLSTHHYARKAHNIIIV